MNKKGNTREKILKTASRLFHLQGYHATGLNQIISESGAPKGSLYYYFPNGKEELAVEAIKFTAEEGKCYLKETLSSHSDPVKAIQEVFKNIAEHLLEIDNLEGAPVGLLSLETWRISEPLRLACEAAFEGWYGLFAAKLVENGFEKERATELGMVFNSMIEGAIVLSVAKKSTKPLELMSMQIPLLLKS